MIIVKSKSLMESSGASGLICRWLMLLGVGLLSPNGVAIAEVRCERETISILVSPDYAWVALVKDGVCTQERSIVASRYTVRLTRTDSIGEIQLAPRHEEPEYENDILEVSDYGVNRPIIQWLSSRKLQIALPNMSGVTVQKSSYQGVEIVVKYDSDDPAARAKWRRERGRLPK
jgi:hypothetical protein